MDNDTLDLEEGPFGKLDEEELDEMRPGSYYPDALQILADLVEWGVLIAAILACVLLIYVIMKFSYLRTRTNVYILHYAICNIILFLLSPMYELIMSLGLHYLLDISVICAIFRIDGICALLVVNFAMVLGVDWFIVIFKNSLLEKYEHLQNYIIGGIYGVHIILYIMMVISCFGAPNILKHNVLIIFYSTALAIVLAINCFTYFVKPNDEHMKLRYSLTISNFVMISWLPVLIFYFTLTYFFHPEFFAVMILEFFVEYCLKFMLFGTPIVVAYWLGTRNDDFRKAYNVVFRRSCEKYNQESLQEDEDNSLIDNEQGHFVTV